MGRLVPLNTVRGRKGPSKILLKIKNALVMIVKRLYLHGDCKEDAEFMAELIKKNLMLKTSLLVRLVQLLELMQGLIQLQYSSLVIIVNYLNSNLTFKIEAILQVRLFFSKMIRFRH